jgi:hypothetical protein
MSDKKSNILAMLVCLAVVLGWFSPWWAGGRNLAPLDLNGEMMQPWRGANDHGYAKNHIVADAVDQYLVYRLAAEKSYHEEGWLGWSSLTYGGTAQYANTMALYYDWTMQLHRWLPFWTAWHVGLIGQALIASWGMFWFLRGRGIGALWSCCGGLAYAANSQFVTWIYHRWALSAFCWVPWILWAIDGYRWERRRFWPLVPLLIGMAFLGGTLQHAALVSLAVAAMWAEEALQAGWRSGPQSRLIGRYLVWGGLGLGLAAMMFLPCTEAFLRICRLHLHTGLYGNAENGIYPQGRLQPLLNLAAYPFQVFPSVLGRCNSVDVLKLFKSELFFVAYFGSLPVVVAFLSLWRKDTPVVARVLIYAGLLLPLTPLVHYLYQRLFLLFILGGILAFAHFMETASRETKLRVFKITALVAGLGATVWTAMSLALVVHPQPLAMIREKIMQEGKGSSFGFFTGWLADRADRFILDLFIWSPQQLVPLLLLGMALAALRWSASERDAWRRAGAWIMTLAVVAEVSLFAARWVVWTDPAKYPLFPATPESEAVQKIVGHDGRVTTLIHPTAHMACTPFIPNTLSPYGIATISGYDSIVPDGMILPSDSTGDARKLGRLGVSHLITWPGNPDVEPAWKLVWRSASMDLYANDMAVPRYVGFGGDREKDAFFTGGSARSWQPLTESTQLENTRRITVPGGTAWVRVAENAGAGWEYRVGRDAVWRDVVRAPDASMLLPLDGSAYGGPVEVEMRYAPPMRRLGFEISGISLLILAAISLCIRRNPEKKGEGAEIRTNHPA